ncbi:MAG: L-threonylcarbamoyladenylate synthase [Comamonadaceae bacterium]|nr:L-threonylcarbamoyladenylate synthase [Comamonadaceae bacterium]
MILSGEYSNSIAAAVDCIRTGGLIGLPTETVYGLAADADNDVAVAGIFNAKGRPADHPLIVHVANAQSASHYAADIPEFAQALMKAFWPGPLTLILPRRAGVANAAAGGHPTIGLRCPAHPIALAVLNWGRMPIHQDESGVNDKQLEPDPHYLWGLAAPSANQFGRVSPTTAAHVAGEFGDGLLILDGGPCHVGIESTIIDCTRGAPVLLRPGVVTVDQVQAVCGHKVLQKNELPAQAAPAPKASGTLESHYAPQARVQLMSAEALLSALEMLESDEDIVAARPVTALYCRSALQDASSHVLYRRMPDDAVNAAQELFAALRNFDAQGVQTIWVEIPPDTPAWDGVRDRLQRAAS